MKLGIVTLFPGMLQAVTEYGVTGRAVRNNCISVNSYNPRDFTQDKHRKVDDRPYGGGPGMLMKVQPLRDAIAKAKQELGQPKVIYLSPQGRRLDQSGVVELASLKSLVLVSGRYTGIDERLLQTDIDEQWSLGDFVLSGGELPAMVFIDAIVRQLPGVLGCQESAAADSFANGLLDCPRYTRPQTIDGLTVPKVLTSGNHDNIELWRIRQQLIRTWQKRPDLLENLVLTTEQEQFLTEFICSTKTLDS